MYCSTSCSLCYYSTAPTSPLPAVVPTESRHDTHAFEKGLFYLQWLSSELQYKWFIDRESPQMENSFRAWGGLLEAVCVCDSRVCVAALAEGKSLDVSAASSSSSSSSSSSFPCHSFSGSVTLAFLSHDLRYNKIKSLSMSTTNTPKQKSTRVAVTAPYPFEVIHVGGLHWSSYECQVVDFRRLLVPLVWLDKQLMRKKKTYYQ